MTAYDPKGQPPTAAAGGFACRRCGACCRWEGHVLLTEADLGALAAHRGLSERDFIERFTCLAANRAQLSLRDGPGGACIFYGEQGCGVYPARPAQCRAFPLGWTVRGGCPGRGEDHPAP